MIWFTTLFCVITTLAYYYYVNITNVDIVFWNLLCEGLGNNQFLTNGGDEINVDWVQRRDKICDKIAEQISRRSIFTCVEVDNYPYMIKYLTKNFPNLNIKGVYIPKINTYKNNSNNNLSIYITTLLNKYNPSIEITPQLKGGELTSAYNKLVEYSNSGSTTQFITFEENGVDDDYMKYLEYIINFPLTKDMPYVSFDCTAIFYSENDYSINGIMSPANNYDASKKFDNFNKFHFDEDGFFGARFIKKSLFKNIEFDVFVSHIKSGENSEAEMKRIKSLESIINIIESISLCNHVLCIDSNTGELYEKSFTKGNVSNKKGEIVGKIDYYVSELLTKFNYNNHVEQNKETMCLKMRAGSDQINKNGEFMADTIDKIITPYHIEANMFIPYYSNISPQEYEIIMKWRNNKKYRQAIKAFCNDESQMWVNDINKNNITQELADYLMDCENKYNVGKVKNIFRKMYPNYNNPSDHPIVGSTITFH